MKKAAYWTVLKIAAALALIAAAWFVNSVEGRVNPAQLGRVAIPLMADRPAPLHTQGKLVSVTGQATTEPLGDNMFLKPGPYLIVRRDFERYGWMQVPKTEQVASGPEYDYRQEWSYNLHDSEGFAVKEGHENPEPRMEKAKYLPKVAQLGRYTFKAPPSAPLELLTEGERLALTPDMIDMSRLKGTLDSDYVYYQDADPKAPKTGDTRIAYYVVPQSSEVTVTGTLDGTEITKNTANKGSTMFTLDVGGNVDVLKAATDEFNASQWRWRLAAGALLLLAYWLVAMLRLGNSLWRLVALFLALGLTAGSVMAAFYLEALSAFGAVMGSAVLFSWWGLGGQAKPDDADKEEPVSPPAPPNPDDYLMIINPDALSDKSAGSLTLRRAARAVIFNGDGLVALMHVQKDGYYKLPGGGIEDGESEETALRRECREEVGTDINVVVALGRILEYRPAMRQESACYLALAVGELGQPSFTAEERAKGFEVAWVSLDDAVRLVRESMTTDHAAFVQRRDSRFLEAAQATLAEPPAPLDEEAKKP